MGWLEGGTLAALFAATHPERCSALVLHGAFAKFSSWFPGEQELQAFFSYVVGGWGTGASYGNYCSSMAGDIRDQAWWARRERFGASPGTAIKLMRLNSAIDASDILPSVGVPTLVVHRTADPIFDVEGGRQLARLIPDAELYETADCDHAPWSDDDLDDIAGKVEEFLTGLRPVPVADRVLASVLFTDIAGSTKIAERLGDKKWQQLLSRHDEFIRGELLRFRGSKVKGLGDGFLATFDGPARAAHAAVEMIKGARQMDLDLRAGVHIGEIQLMASDISGLAVHIAARIVAAAAPGECLASRTIKDLVAGSELNFFEKGAHQLKGIAEPIELFSVTH